MEQKCPHCGAPLPEGASFCPHCAKPLQGRKEARKAVPLRRKLLIVLGIVVVIAAGLTAWYVANRPETYEGKGGVYYSDENGDYQIAIAFLNARTTPQTERWSEGIPGEQYRFPSMLFINDAVTGEDATEAFSKNLESITAEVLDPTEGNLEMTCTAPAHEADYVPEAIVVSFVDYMNSGKAEMVWTITMKNGDTIKLSQDMIIEETPVYDYHYEDYPMETTEELEALIGEISQTVESNAIVNLYLPPVTYEGPVEIPHLGMNIYGCTDGPQRTTFTGPVQVVAMKMGWITYFYDIDFTGSGTGIGVSTSVNTRLTGCNVSGWETGVLAYSSAWVNVMESHVFDCGIGFHFNSDGDSANDSRYNDNLIETTGTAVLLENVPTDLTLQFSGTVFRNNGTDIDNRSGHELNLEETVFE